MPQAGDEIILPRAASAIATKTAPDGMSPDEALNATQTEPAIETAHREHTTVDSLAADTGQLVAPAMDEILDQLGELVAKSTSLEELRTALLTLAPDISTKALARALREAQVVARLSGRADLIDG